MQPTPPKLATINLTRPNLRSWALGVLIILTTYAALEIIFRIPAVQSALPAPNLADNYELGTKVEMLNAMRRDEGAPDCLLVGSSVALQGFNPAVVEQVVFEKTGQRLRCFNFAINGMTAPPMVTLTRILAAQLHPRVIVYGLNFRDVYERPNLVPNPPAFVASPWMAAQLGEPSLAGWFEGSSYTYRHFATLRWYALSFGRDISVRADYMGRLQPDGYVRVVGIWPHIDKIPDTLVKQPYRTSPESLDYLRQLGDLRAGGASVFIVEIPLPPNSMHLLSGGRPDYQVYLDAVSQTASEAGVPFWQTASLVAPITEIDGWADPIHLNHTGGDFFSVWIGEQIAASLP